GGQLDLRGPNSRPRQTGEATPPSLCPKTNLALPLTPSLPEYPLRLSPYSTSASRFAGSLPLSHICIRRKTLSDSHLQIGIEFQPWGSLPRPSASCLVWNRSAPFGAAPQPSIPTALPNPTRPGIAPDPRRSLTVDNNVI